MPLPLRREPKLPRQQVLVPASTEVYDLSLPQSDYERMLAQHAALVAARDRYTKLSRSMSREECIELHKQLFAPFMKKSAVARLQPIKKPLPVTE